VNIKDIDCQNYLLRKNRSAAVLYIAYIISYIAVMEENTTETETRNPLKQAIIIGVLLITIASIVRFVRQWISYPAEMTSAGDFFRLLIDSFKYVLNFDFKLWWVFLLIIYIIARWYKKSDIA